MPNVTISFNSLKSSFNISATVICIITFLPNKKHVTKQAEQNCEITVATAAPHTPNPSTNINTGSRTILTAAPSIVENIPIFGNP